jgi:hypothetical protein
VKLKRARQLLKKWLDVLGLAGYSIALERISLLQVSDDYCNVGNSFVGIEIDFANTKGRIYHTRILTEEDIVHELLHVKYPYWSEKEVNATTNMLLKNRREQPGMLTKLSLSSY